LVVPALVAGDFASKPIAYQTVVALNTRLCAGFRARVIKAFRSEWFGVNDRVGWVDRNPMPRIDAAVRELCPGGRFLFNIWDRFEANLRSPLRIAAQVIGSIVGRDPFS
jgi:hypothetical protein